MEKKRDRLTVSDTLLDISRRGSYLYALWWDPKKGLYSVSKRHEDDKHEEVLLRSLEWHEAKRIFNEGEANEKPSVRGL